MAQVIRLRLIGKLPHCFIIPTLTAGRKLQFLCAVQTTTHLHPFGVGITARRNIPPIYISFLVLKIYKPLQ